LVDQELGRKINIHIKKSIEDVIRKLLGKPLQELEVGLRPTIEKEVQEQAGKVEQEIKQIVPAKTLGKEVAEGTPPPAPSTTPPPPAPPAPPAAPPKPVAPPAPPKELPLPPQPGASASLGNPALADALKTVESKVNKTKSTKEVDSMFKVSYHGGDSFNTSYFVGSDGTKVKVVSAARIVPMELQQRIAEAEAKGEAVEGLIAPEDAEAQIIAAAGGTLEGFENWAAQLPKITRSASVTRQAEWAVNEAEIPKVDMPKDGPFTSVDEKEAAASRSTGEGTPNGVSSKVKSYYGRLPGKAVGETEEAINKQSKISQTYQMMKRALEEKELELGKISEEKGQVEKELGDMKQKDDMTQTKGKVDALMSELKKLKPIDPEAEKDMVDILVKVKDLAPVIDAIKRMSGEKDGLGMGLGMGMGMGKSPAIPLPPKPASQQVIGGVNLPQISPSSEPVTLIDVVSGLFDHD